MSATPKVLFLCTGNSCRSQMAEGWARHLRGSVLQPFSAGLDPQELHPMAVEVMAEAGVDISGQRSKHLHELARTTDWDYVVTVCHHADEHCPHLPGRVRVAHRGFRDPARSTGNEEQVRATFRRVRDQIRTYVETLPESLETEALAQEDRATTRGR